MHTLLAPRLNSNDLEVTVTALHVQVGQVVKAGQALLTVESTKVAAEVCAEHDGLVRAVYVEVGQRIATGAALLLTTDGPDEPIPASPPSTPAPDAQAPPPPSTRRATLPAADFARRHGIDLDTLEFDGIIKVADLEAWLRQRRPPALPADLPVAENHVVLLGAGGHARAVIDLLRQARRDLIPLGALDDLRPPGSEVMGVSVLGPLDTLEALAGAGLGWALVAIGALQRTADRNLLYDRLQSLRIAVPTLVHPRAIVEPSARLGAGVQVFGGAIVGACAVVDDNVIVNSGAIVSHDCVLHRGAHLAPGAALAGGVEVGPAALVGMGVSVHVGVRIGAGAVIGNGLAVFDDVPPHAVLKPRRP